MFRMSAARPLPRPSWPRHRVRAAGVAAAAAVLTASCATGTTVTPHPATATDHTTAADRTAADQLTPAETVVFAELVDGQQRHTVLTVTQPHGDGGCVAAAWLPDEAALDTADTLAELTDNDPQLLYDSQQHPGFMLVAADTEQPRLTTLNPGRFAGPADAYLPFHPCRVAADLIVPLEAGANTTVEHDPDVADQLLAHLADQAAADALDHARAGWVPTVGTSEPEVPTIFGGIRYRLDRLTARFDDNGRLERFTATEDYAHEPTRLTVDVLYRDHAQTDLNAAALGVFSRIDVFLEAVATL